LGLKKERKLKGAYNINNNIGKNKQVMIYL